MIGSKWRISPRWSIQLLCIILLYVMGIIPNLGRSKLWAAEHAPVPFCIRTLTLPKSSLFDSQLSPKQRVISWLRENPQHCDILQIEDQSQKMDETHWRTEFQKLPSQVGLPQRPELRFAREIGALTLFSGKLDEDHHFFFRIHRTGWWDAFEQLTGPRRGFSFYAVKVGPERVPVYVLHSQFSSSSQKIRVSQIFELLDWMAYRMPQSAPVIANINLQAAGDSVEWRLLNRVLAFKDARETALECSNCPNLPQGNFNFIFYKPRAQWHLVPTKVQIDRNHLTQEVSFNLRAPAASSLTPLESSICVSRAKIAEITLNEGLRTLGPSASPRLRQMVATMLNDLSAESPLTRNLCNLPTKRESESLPSERLPIVPYASSNPGITFSTFYR